MDADLSVVDDSWRPLLTQAWAHIQNQHPTYVQALSAHITLISSDAAKASDSGKLIEVPRQTNDELSGSAPQLLITPLWSRVFCAFSQPLSQVRYVLIGESPYPRLASATGYAFMDGQVESLWRTTGGLHPRVNRATSLRNFIKMLLIADGLLGATDANNLTHLPTENLIQTGAQLQHNLTQAGFLLLNANLIWRSDVPVRQDQAIWQDLMQAVMQLLSQQATKPVVLLWGKVAQNLQALCQQLQLPMSLAEHPYNLSFIHREDLHSLFRPLKLLHRNTTGRANIN